MIQAIRESDIALFSRPGQMSSSPLTPKLALAYIEELQPALRGAAIVGPGAALVAGVEGPAADVARALLDGGGDGDRRAEGGALAVRSRDHAAAAELAGAVADLAELDLRAALSAL